jgi:hypothetical protein
MPRRECSKIDERLRFAARVPAPIPNPTNAKGHPKDVLGVHSNGRKQGAVAAPEWRPQTGFFRDGGP